MRTLLIALTVALVASGCASLAEDPHAGHDTSAGADGKPARCGMHAAHAAHAGSSAPGHGGTQHCAHMKGHGLPARP